MRLILFLCLFSLDAKAMPNENLGLDAIYGIDEREFVSKKSPNSIQEISLSVALIVDSSLVDKGLFKSNISARPLSETLKMCPDERFAKNPSVPNCTGFMVGPDVMASAGHCFMTKEDCENKKIIFDVDATTQKNSGYRVFNSSVFSCKKIIAQEFGETRDFSLIKLNRALQEKRAPLKLNLSKKIADGASVFMIGHPFGLPLMYSHAASVDKNDQDTLFFAGLDSFDGNSGSPVINSKTLQVEGILVSGREDLVLDPKNKCYRNASYEGVGGEGVLRISELPHFLK